jgi:TATA-binding related factor (TRF) of subunit 20 of Mediator complex
VSKLGGVKSEYRYERVCLSYTRKGGDTDKRMYLVRFGNDARDTRQRRVRRHMENSEYRYNNALYRVEASKESDENNEASASSSQNENENENDNESGQSCEWKCKVVDDESYGVWEYDDEQVCVVPDKGTLAGGASLLRVLELAKIYEQRQLFKIMGSWYCVGDFSIGMASVLQGLTMRSEIVIEVVYEPCVVVDGCVDILREFLALLLDDDEHKINCRIGVGAMTSRWHSRQETAIQFVKLLHSFRVQHQRFQ